MTLPLFRDLLARLQLEVASLPDDHLPETLKKGLLKLTRWIDNIYHITVPQNFSLFKGTTHFHFLGTMKRLTSLEREHVTVAKKYICDGRNTFLKEDIHLLWKRSSNNENVYKFNVPQ